MAVFNVTINATRIKDFENATGVFSIGGGQGGAAEPSAPYQGTNDYNRKLTDTTFNGRGFYYDPTADGQGSFNLPSLGAVMVKMAVSDYGGLNLQNPLRIRLGSGTSAYHDAVVIGTDSLLPSFQEYPAVGGYIIIPVDLSIAAYRYSTSGSPNLAAATYFGFIYRFISSQAKSENCFASALDVGTGMSATGGDGANNPGSWVDFPNADEGDNTNGRYGFGTRYKEKIFGYGHWNIGDGAIATEFEGKASESVTWLDGLFAPGWSGPVIDLSRAGDVFSDAATHDSSGTATTSDTRADYTFTGNATSCTVTHVLNNFRNYNMSGSVICSGNIQVASISQNNGSIIDATVRCNSEANQAVIVSPNLSNISGVIFRQTKDGHALEITAPGTYNLNDLSFEGFDDSAVGTNLTPNSGASNAVVYNNSGGLVTLNLVNGSNSPSVRNGAGATTDVVSSVALTLTGIAENSEVTIVRVSDDFELFHVENVGAGGSVTFSYGSSEIGVTCNILVHNVIDFEPIDPIILALPSTNTSIPISQSEERVFA